MNEAIQKGLGFGLTSGIITTLGLMVGLSSGTHLRSAVLGGILTIAIADALSDAFGVHVSEEAENKHSAKEVWISTSVTFVCKFLFAITFAVPVLFFSLRNALIISIIWGFSLLLVYSIYIARKDQEKPVHVAIEHLTIAVLVIIITHFTGLWIGKTFN